MMITRLTAYIVLVFFIMQLDAYIYLLGFVNIAPFQQILLAGSFLVVICLLIESRCIPARLTKESIVLLFCFLLYVCVQVVGVLAWDAIPDDKFILVFWTYMVVLLCFGALSGVLIGYRVPYVLFGILVIFIAVTVVDALIGGVNVSVQSDRIASTLRNPNIAAFLIVVLLLGSFRWERVGLMEIISIVLAGLGIIMTQSRGGLLAYLVTIICFSVWSGSLGRTIDIQAKRYLVSGVFGLLAISIVLVMLFANRYGLDKLDHVSSAILFDSPSRDSGIQTALELINSKPIFGHGTGFIYAQELGPHNMFLRALVENGVLGLIAFLALLLGLLWFGLVRSDKTLISLTMVLGAIAMTTHNLTEARSILIVVGMLLANSSRKKAARNSMGVSPYYNVRTMKS